MSYFIDRISYFAQNREKFSDGHGVTTEENRAWEEAYRGRWAHDKIVRSTHGVNCTGSCSWKIYVKNGLITWETQQTDYPRTRPDLPNHEPRGCARGASYSWYIYSANRLKYPLIRKRLLKMWRAMKEQHSDPVDTWKAIQADPVLRAEYQIVRGKGGFVRADWEEANEIIAASNIHTIKEHGPDRIFGFSPIPAMSMVSYAAGSRYLSLLGGVCMSFYDWYCDLPPASPQTWGEQTDVPESADWYNSGFIIMWGSNVPQTRTPDAHFMTEARYKGTQVVTITPDYSEASKFGDIWLNPKQGTDAAVGMAMGHVILKEFHLENTSAYFDEYTRKYSDFPFLVKLEKRDGRYVPGRMVRASDFDKNLGHDNNPEWKTICLDEKTGDVVVPTGSIGFRWGEDGEWNILPTDSKTKKEFLPQKTLLGSEDDILDVGFPYFAGAEHEHGYFEANDQGGDILDRKLPVKYLEIDGEKVPVVTVFDLTCANYGIAREGLGGDNVASSYDENVPYTPKWQESITGVAADKITQVAREFARNAHETKGKSMIIIGAAMNHWYHMDMNYRACINMLVFCGCIGQSGGGWSHYVGQEKLRPQTGWLPLAFGLDWTRPPRQMNSTSAFYAHTDQWRYETLGVTEILCPTADKEKWKGSLIDCNIRAERMGWLPSAPQLQENPIELVKKAGKKDPVEYVTERLSSGDLRMSCEDPDSPDNWPRNLFVWRSNLLGSSGKGHEYFLKHFLGTQHGVQGKDLGEEGRTGSEEVVWHDEAPEGKLDLVVTLDFRMSTTCMYSDIVLPTASWYEKNDLNTSDMHPFIHPLSKAIDPVWQSRSDWEIYKGFAKKVSELSPGHLGVEKEIVLTPIQHDTPGELAQPDVKEWRKGECDLIPGVTAPSMKVVERDYPATYERFTSLGPLLEKLGNGGKGIGWNTDHEVEFLKALNGENKEGRANIVTDIDACETVMMLAPETNGEVAVKAWEALGKITGRDHTHLAKPKEDEKIRFRDIQAQPRKIISSPTWSGIESEEVCYNAGYTNVHEYIPWRTLTGRQQLYQDHPWMLDFGEGLVSYKPPINTATVQSMIEKHGDDDRPHITLNFITPHQKWGIHSTYSDNLHMLTLSRGGPIVWMSEPDAKKTGIKDNDWVEVFNTNGAITARAVVSQRVNDGMLMMYHAQEKIVNTPGSKITGARGGIHNSVTRTTVKPTHMIGAYAQQSYGFNYYGTVGSNRDEFVVVRKIEDQDIDWMEGPLEGQTDMEAAE